MKFLSPLPSLFLLSFLSFTSSLLLKIDHRRKEYCFRKTLLEDDKLQMSFIVSSDKSEKINVKLTNEKTGSVLFQSIGQQNGEFKSPTTLKEGKYMLCFLPQDRSTYFVSFDFNSYLETGMVNDLAKDKEVQLMVDDIREIKNVFEEIEKQMRYTNDRKFRHTTILKDIIRGLKNLTTLKVVIVGVFSVFQVFIIQKFFGPDKRVSTVKGAFSNNVL